MLTVSSIFCLRREKERAEYSRLLQAEGVYCLKRSVSRVRNFVGRNIMMGLTFVILLQCLHAEMFKSMYGDFTTDSN